MSGPVIFIPQIHSEPRACASCCGSPPTSHEIGLGILVFVAVCLWALAPLIADEQRLPGLNGRRVLAWYVLPPVLIALYFLAR